mgnify:CR=1 FL=1
MQTLQRLEGIDFSTIHTVLCLIGALLAVYQMQLVSHEHEDRADPTLIRWGRRIALMTIAISLLLLVLYADARQWQPWPPQIALVLAVIVMLGIRVLAIHARIQRDRRNRRDFTGTLTAANRNHHR